MTDTERSGGDTGTCRRNTGNFERSYRFHGKYRSAGNVERSGGDSRRWRRFEKIFYRRDAFPK
jgi:hypothetical protein